MDIIDLVVVIVLAIGLVELIFNILFKKDSSDREFASLLFSPKYLAKGAWVIWLSIGLWGWFFALSCTGD